MQARADARFVYPDSDGERMAENTLQFEWIVTLKGNLDAALPDFVAGDLLWYPEEGHPEIRRAPDVLVALGRPKGHRGSYRQWEEQGVAPQVVIEVLSPGNTGREMLDELAFYDRYGVDEYYVIDPADGRLEAWLRTGPALQGALVGKRFTSPILGVTFVRDDEGLRVLHADGAPFRSFREILTERERAVDQRDAAVARAERLAERLRALGVDPDVV